MHLRISIILMLAFLAGACVRTPTVSSPTTRPSSATHDPSHMGHAPASQPIDPIERIVHPFSGVTVHLGPNGQSSVWIDATVCLDEGYLEQIACAPNSREHESLVVVHAQPRQIHAALLMAGFNPGTPGRWTYENETFGTVKPSGDKIAVSVRHPDAMGRIVEHPVQDWIYGAAPAHPDDRDVQFVPFPDLPWVFGGSRIEPNPPSMGPGEHYVADMTGSVIGLVTFGDEVIGFSRVLADQADVQAPEWEINTEVIPPIGTQVDLILRHWTKE